MPGREVFPWDAPIGMEIAAVDSAGQPVTAKRDGGRLALAATLPREDRWYRAYCALRQSRALFFWEKRPRRPIRKDEERKEKNERTLQNLCARRF